MSVLNPPPVRVPREFTTDPETLGYFKSVNTFLRLLYDRTAPTTGIDAEDVTVLASSNLMQSPRIEALRQSFEDLERLVAVALARASHADNWDLYDDNSPELGADLDALNQSIDNARTISIAGQKADYDTAGEYPNFVHVDEDHNYSYNYLSLGLGTYIPGAFWFTGTHTLGANGFLFGMGSLFVSKATIKNDGSVAANMTPFYTLAATNTYQADTQSISYSQSTDVYSEPIFTTANGGTMTVANHSGYIAKINVGSGVTVTARHGLYVDPGTITGTVTGQSGITVGALTGSTNRTNILTGTNTIPSGTFNLYQSGTSVNRWNGGHRFKVRDSSSTTVTITTADGTVRMSSTSTVTCTLPSATGCTGFVITLKKTGASGTINVKSVSSQTADGVDITSGSIAMSTQYHVVILQSNGTNWDVLKNGLP